MPVGPLNGLPHIAVASGRAGIIILARHVVGHADQRLRAFGQGFNRHPFHHHLHISYKHRTGLGGVGVFAALKRLARSLAGIVVAVAYCD